MRKFLATTLVVSCLMFAPAYAANYPLKVANDTSHYAWITLYYAYTTHGSNIEHAFCLHPFEVWKGSITYNAPELGAELKVRAEVKVGDCRTGNFKDVYNRLNIPTNYHPYPYLSAYLNERKGVYGIAMRASVLPQ